MGYRFHGFFAQFADGLVEAATQRWPHAGVKVLYNPFFGVGLRLPDVADAKTDEEAEKLLALQDELPEWTVNFPEATFVYVDANCFGGHCEYEGYVCKNGEKSATASGDNALTRLFSHLGVRLKAERGQAEYFEPFRRDYHWW